MNIPMKSVWITPNGVHHEIPARFAGVKIKKDGWPDKRDALYGDFIAWAESLDAAEMAVEGADVTERVWTIGEIVKDPVVVNAVHSVDAFLAEPLEAPRSLEPSGPNPFALAFAKAVWNAQSPDAPRKWRLERVALAMSNKGFSMEGIEL